MKSFLSLLFVVCFAALAVGRDDPIGDPVTFAFNSPTQPTSARISVGSESLLFSGYLDVMDDATVGDIAAIFQDGFYDDVTLDVGGHSIVVPDAAWGNLSGYQVTAIEFGINSMPLTSGWVYSRSTVTWYGYQTGLGSVSLPEPTFGLFVFTPLFCLTRRR